MTGALTDWAEAFLQEDHVAVASTLNSDGSPHVTTTWYLLEGDGTLITTYQVTLGKRFMSLPVPSGLGAAMSVRSTLV